MIKAKSILCVLLITGVSLICSPMESKAEPGESTNIRLKMK